MEYIKIKMVDSIKYLRGFLKWILISLIIGSIGGLLGGLFHIGIDEVTHIREKNGYLILFLPIGGIIITYLYKRFANELKVDTNCVIESARKNERVPFVMMPLIFISTIITHFLGGSAGREGAALQLGGSLGYNIGKLLKIKPSNMRLVIMTGMSSVFSALFKTPVTAAIFSMEVINIGEFHYAGFMPALISSITAYFISSMLGNRNIDFGKITPDELLFANIGKVILLAVLCALVSILFCTAIKGTSRLMRKYFKNDYLRAFVGGVIIIILTVIIGNQDYNGAGMNVIERAMQGETKPFSFLIKIVFTAITIASGFKGGEIVPAFFTGSTFGCMIAPLVGVNPAFASAIGFITLFCGVVNCPIASIILSIELFGTDGFIFFAIASAVGYVMSGRFGLYRSQKILYSKISDEFIDENSI